MISIRELLYELDMKMNNLASNKDQENEIPNRIIALNQAQIQFVKKRYNLNNLYRDGFDSGMKRYEELEFLVVPHKSFKLKKATHSKRYNAYEADLTKKINDYFIYVDSYCLCDKDTCKERVVVNKVIKHSDLQVKFNNMHTVPSFEYQEELAVISDTKFIVYTDGTYEPKSLELSYIRYPKLVDFEGYEHFDGSLSTEIDSEFPYSAKDELLNLAVAELSMNTTNQNQIPTLGQRFNLEE